MSECHPQLLLITFRGQRVGGRKWNSSGMMAVFIRPRSEGQPVQVWIKILIDLFTDRVWTLIFLAGVIGDEHDLSLCSTISTPLNMYQDFIFQTCVKMWKFLIQFPHVFTVVRAWFTTYQAYVHTAAEYSCQSCFRALNTVRFTLGLVINRSDIAFNNPNRLH